MCINCAQSTFYWLALLIRPTLSEHKKSLFLVIFLPLITHPLLDAFTTYGTQLLWPINIPPVNWSSIFIIDPLYTLPLLFGIIGLWLNFRSPKWQKINAFMLLVSSLYLIQGQVQRLQINSQLEQDPIAQNGQVFISPTPLIH
ncbi:metal-dependent hydrolase [Psychromonas sp. KJ10-2]|uniref:metal-dependent hydrolase n=1 Tax=Psychromonas sp. KJ10-2 TaxID=3391822 RepID=UPI0039B46E3D